MIKNTQHEILVPHDFTEVADYAIEHAVVIAKNVGDNITLTHIIKSEKEYDEAKKKLEEIAEETKKKHDIKPNTVVREGKIFNTIGEVADEVEADLVIMGTHGIRGMQKLTGSWALKVIVSSQVPFIVVQEPPHNERFENILFPVDFQKESREKLNWVNYLSKFYQLKINIFKRNESNLKENIDKNIFFTRKYLKKLDLDYSIHVAQGKKSFEEETIEYARKLNVDLILIMTTKDIGFTDYVMGAAEQYVIANSAKIPVMCVNPLPAKFITSGSGAGMGV